MNPKTSLRPNPKKVWRRKIKNTIAITVACISIAGIPSSIFILDDEPSQHRFVALMLFIFLCSFGCWRYDHPSYD